MPTGLQLRNKSLKIEIKHKNSQDEKCSELGAYKGVGGNKYQQRPYGKNSSGPSVEKEPGIQAEMALLNFSAEITQNFPNTAFHLQGSKRFSSIKMLPFLSTMKVSIWSMSVLYSQPINQLSG